MQGYLTIGVKRCESGSSWLKSRSLANPHQRTFSSTVPKIDHRKRIHVLGMGNLSRFVAHAIKKQHPETPITLLLHRSSLLEDWKKADQSVEIITDGVSDKRKGFDVEMVSEGTSPIHRLVLGTKTYSCAAAIMPLRERLGRESTILLMQNGMGSIDEVSATCFPDKESRPNYVAAIVNHGIYSKGPFSAVHAGFAPITIGRVQQDTSAHLDPNPDYLSQLVVSTPILGATWVQPDQLLHAQLIKLAVNSSVNPLTVIFNCQNGELIGNAMRTELQHALLREVSQVLQEIIFRSSNRNPNPDILERFSFDGLLSVLKDIAERTKKNYSSMYQDVAAGKKTEIDFMNGYIVKRAGEFGIEVPVNTKIVDMVKSLKTIEDEEIKQTFGTV